LVRVAVEAVSLGVVVSAPGAAEATTGSIVVRLVTDRRHLVLRGPYSGVEQAFAWSAEHRQQDHELHDCEDHQDHQQCP
jgi:hypothetical protein